MLSLKNETKKLAKINRSEGERAVQVRFVKVEV